MSGGSWRVAGRLARREVRRHPWRHALVVALIAVPVLAVFATFSLLETWQQVEAQRRAYELAGRDGAFGAVIDTGEGTVTYDGVEEGDPQLLPPGTETEAMHRGADWFVTGRDRPDGAGPALAGARVLDAPDGSRRAAQVVIERGRLPLGDDEVALTPALARAGGWQIGDQVESARTAQRFDVVGIGALGADTDAAAAIVGDVPDGYWTAHLGITDSLEAADGSLVPLRTTDELGIWLPPGWEEESVLWQAGATSMAPVELVDERVRPSVILGATAVCAVAATVASAAFALASRRQLRSIGLLSSIGTDPATIRRLLLLQGAIPGLVAGAVAVLVGTVAAAVANSLDAAASITDVAGATVEVSAGGALLAVALATASGVAAAWIPARAASRVPVLSALGGRRPAPALPTRVPLGGLVLWAVGGALIAWGVRANRYPGSASSPFALILGTSALALGAIAVAPLLVIGLDRLASRATGLLRLAMRGLVRQRGQSAATIAAVGVALALPVGFLTARATDPTSSTDVVDIEADTVPEATRFAPLLQDDATVVRIEGDLRTADAEELTASALRILGPDAVVVETLALADDDDRYWLVTAVPPAAASEILVPEAAAALAAGQLVRTEPDAPAGGPLALRSGDDRLPLEVAPLGPVPGTVEGMPSGLLVSTDVLGDFGRGRPISGRAIVRPGAPSDDDERLAIEGLGWASTGSGTSPTLEAIRSAPDRSTGLDASPEAWAWVAAPTPVGSDETYDPDAARTTAEQRLLLALAAGATVIALSVLAITLSLRGYDGRDDQRAALAAGAAPGRLRSVRAIEGSVLALAGAVLALPLGWSAVTAARLGQVQRTFEEPSIVEAARGQLAGPGWIVIPILLLPAVVAGALWLVVPAIAAWAAERHGPRDVLAPRW